MSSLQGYFLVASPHLPDPNFYRTVVLIVQHDENGALGLVLNRPTDKTVGQLWESVTEEPCLNPQSVNHGGPVEGPLMALHQNVASGESEVVPGVFFASSDENLEQIVQHFNGPFRLFVGYAGWAGGQLESELEAGGWLTIEATCDDVFDEDEDLWKKIACRIGMEILETAVDPRHIPEDVSLN